MKLKDKTSISQAFKKLIFINLYLVFLSSNFDSDKHSTWQ